MYMTLRRDGTIFRWAWASVAGDIVDVAVLFVGGVGETIKCAGKVNNATNVIDAAKQSNLESGEENDGMVLNINEVITDSYILKEGYIYRDGFVFVEGEENPVIYNRLLIRVPKEAREDAIMAGKSWRTIDEHITLINQHKIEKLLVICDDLKFILDCSSVTDIEIWPSYSAPNGFDYSYLYKMPNLKTVSCRTVYGGYEENRTTVDYSQINGLEEIIMHDNYGHKGYKELSTLKKINIIGNKKINNFTDVTSSVNMEEVTIFECNIRELSGIEKLHNIKELTLWHNYSLNDISALEHVSNTLKELDIEACSKITDFSVLKKLVNLEFLTLEGNNKIPNLDFLQNMKKLKFFSFTMNIEDGKLDLCMDIPYVSCRNRKHYNLKDDELPKELPFVHE